MRPSRVRPRGTFSAATLGCRAAIAARCRATFTEAGEMAEEAGESGGVTGDGKIGGPRPRWQRKRRALRRSPLDRVINPRGEKRWGGGAKREPHPAARAEPFSYPCR
jgi:hypothetical protein